MKLTHFRDFMAVVETGSLRSAGRLLGIAQPVITRSIRELEHELGVTLFERHAKGARLTPLGERFARRVETFQNELRRAREEIGQMKGEESGEVSVTLSPVACMSLMPVALAAFTRNYPDGVVKIAESLFQPVEKDILSGKIDFYVGPIDPSAVSAQFTAELLFENRRRIVGRKEHPLRGARDLSELVGARWVRPTASPRSNTEVDFDTMFKRAGLPSPNIVVHARSSLITVLAVAHTDMLSVLPQQWVEFTPLGHLIEPFDLLEPMNAASMYIVRRQGLPLTPMAEHLCDLIRKAGHNYHLSKMKREKISLSTLEHALGSPGR